MNENQQYPGQSTQQPQPQQPQYRQPYPQQQPQQYPGYQQPYQQYPQQQPYAQYPQYAPAQQPQTPSPPEQKRELPTKAIGILLGIIILAIAAFLVIKLIPTFMAEEEAAAPQMVEVKPSIRFTSNALVFDDEILLPRDSNSYDVGDEVFIYSVFKDFDQISNAQGTYDVELSYGLSVSQPQTNTVYTELSNENLVIIRKTFPSPVDDYYFTAKVPTLGLLPGFYTMNLIGRDRLSGKKVEKTLEFELNEPLQLKVVTLILGEIDAETEVLVPKNKLYTPGEVVQAYFEIRGFDVVNNTPDVVVDLYITDADGKILFDVSKTAVYVNNVTYLTKPVVMMVNLNVPTANLVPGDYNLQILAQDKLARISSILKTPFTIVERD